MTVPGNNRPIVYSSDLGRVCPKCQKPSKACICRQGRVVPRGDGVVRVSRDRRNRRGKTVTVIDGVPTSGAGLEELATTLKRLCGSGGTVKEGVIEIQGDHRDAVVSKLTELGYRVKLAGG